MRMTEERSEKERIDRKKEKEGERDLRKTEI